MSESFLPAVPPQMPQFAPSFAGYVCRWILARSGWRLTGEFPDLPKLVLIAAPHSSNWDVVWGLLVKIALRIEVHSIAKREAFFWPLGPLLRMLGGIPINRKAAHGVVDEMRKQFTSRERFWLVITPEGTRKKVKKWKNGFWHIAHAAEVPILLVYFHYPEKIIGLGPLLQPSNDLAADMEKIHQFYRPWQGKYHGSR